MIKIQTLLTTTVLLVGISGSVIADKKDGWDAYAQGEYKTVFNEYEPLAEQGDALAQYILGVMYSNGKGVLKDDKEAVKWYLKAAEQGNAKAQFNLGLMYDNSEGVLKDYKEAVKWYLKAAEQGQADAQLNLGLMYAKGQGVLKDLSKAKYWIKKAYENPDASADLMELVIEAWNKLELWKY